MKNTTKLLLGALLVAIIFNSCKKSDSNSPTGTSMKFTSNGAAVSFNSCVAISATVGNTSEVLITGINITNAKPGASSFEVELTHDINTLKAGQTYPVASSFSQLDASTLYYFTNASDVFNTQTGNAQGTVSITEVTSTSIKGTFSGKLFAENDFTGTTVLYTITNGSFTAKRGN
ncbi:hypothetical protein [Mucilaginibacter sp. OK098]|uniref:hypothetical protein n=1 Tax=Mucilaginibacter sp. OK098 TaxID=1855297 RepID=UPI0009213FC7|nr:hypothetical protein [Mucilaginibacter sp. OK098]SHN34748.1 hypothetical protein SAMN05216524_11193 [Mucilaginibacter sp. OK098]